VGYNLPVQKWFDLVGEFLVAGGHPSTALSWFFAVMSSLQQSFNSDCCLYRICLFIEPLCILEPPCAAQENAQLVYGFFKAMDKTIAYCLVILDRSLYLVLLDYSMYHCCIFLGCPPFCCYSIPYNPLSLICLEK
jgi:hypothetical protein